MLTAFTSQGYRYSWHQTAPDHQITAPEISRYMMVGSTVRDLSITLTFYEVSIVILISPVQV